MTLTVNQNKPDSQIWAETHAMETSLGTRLSDNERLLLAALKEIQTICREDNAAFRKRMGTKVGNILEVAEVSLKAVQS